MDDFDSGAHPSTKHMGKVTKDDCTDWRDACSMFPSDVADVWHATIHATTVVESLTVCGFDIRAEIVCSKNIFVLGRGDYQHEPSIRWPREHARDQSTLWSIVAATPGMSTGDVIHEPFCGSAPRSLQDILRRDRVRYDVWRDQAVW